MENISINRIKWFKRIFLGLLGSLALTKALLSFHSDVLSFQTFTIYEFKDILAFLERPFIYNWLILIYFILNVIRYYMSTYIFESNSQSYNICPSIFWNDLTKNKDIDAELNKFIKEKMKQGNEDKNNEKRTPFLTITDLFLYTLVFFFLGLAGVSIGHLQSFAVISIAILLLDLFQIFYQKFSYMSPFIKRVLSIKDKFHIWIDEFGKKGQNEKDNAEEVLTLLNEHDTSEFNFAQRTLHWWILVDLLEIVTWFILLFFVVKNPNQLYISCTIIALLVIYFFDIRKNYKTWNRVLGNNITIE